HAAVKRTSKVDGARRKLGGRGKPGLQQLLDLLGDGPLVYRLGVGELGQLEQAEPPGWLKGWLRAGQWGLRCAVTRSRLRGAAGDIREPCEAGQRLRCGQEAPPDPLVLDLAQTAVAPPLDLDDKLAAGITQDTHLFGCVSRSRVLCGRWARCVTCQPP